MAILKFYTMVNERNGVNINTQSRKILSMSQYCDYKNASIVYVENFNLIFKCAMLKQYFVFFNSFVIHCVFI